MPAQEGVQDVHRVVALGGGQVLAVGRSEDGFAAWVRDGDGWSGAAGFGAVAGSWRGAPYVASLVRTPVGVLATLSTGDHYELWQTNDGRTWRQVDVPLEPQTAGDHSLVAADGDALLLVGDAGDGGHVWSGTVEPAG
jgi:hypothetical protein